MAKYANTKAQLKTKKACVRATCVVTGLEAVTSTPGFEPKRPLSPQGRGPELVCSTAGSFVLIDFTVLMRSATKQLLVWRE